MSGPCLFVIGPPTRTPARVRERLALASEGAIRDELVMVAGIRELAVLSTCNRVEFYGSGPTKPRGLGAGGVLRDAGFDPAEFERIRIRLTGREAALHLFEVASGLDSQLVGENEIFGQVKEPMRPPTPAAPRERS